MNNRKDAFNKILLETQPSGIRKFFEMLVGNDDVISLSVGEPDFTTPWSMREEAFYHLEKGHTSYTSNWGLLELREEIAKYMQKYELVYNPKNEILLTIGASEGIDLALRAVLNEGDEVIVAEPCYVSYEPLAALMGAKVKRLDTSKTSFIPTACEIEKLITPRTKALVLCSPNNPTGTAIPKDEQEKIAALVVKNRIWCISDEIYSELVYEGYKHTSVASFSGMKDYAVVLNGFAKSFAMTGWRIGWMAASESLMKQVIKIHQYGCICAPIMSQYAALEGLRHGWSEVEKMRKSYEQRRNYMEKALSEMGFTYPEAKGAFYIFPSIAHTGLSDEEFALKLFKEYNVAVVPGSAFGRSGAGSVRLCYATGIDKIKSAMSRIKDMVGKIV